MASCKFEGGKYKGATEVKAHFRHNDISLESRKIARKKNKHIDLNKCKYNFSILGLSYEQRCKKYDDRIAYLDCHGNPNKRKDRVTGQCIEIPVPAGLPRDLYNDWFIRVAQLLRARYGEENFIDADIHYDEEHEYRDPETMELVISRVHGHYMIVPEINGILNCKQMTLRKNMKSLNREIDEMTRKEFGCSFMSGKKTKSLKTVEELKLESENAELLHQMDQEREEIIARQTALTAHKAALAARDRELQEKEEKLLKTQNTLSEWKDNLEQQKEAVRQKERQLDEAVKAVTEMPSLDACVEKVLDVAFVKYKIPGTTETMDFIARRYLESLRESQQERAEEICKTVRRTVPEYSFNTPQSGDEMEF